MRADRAGLGDQRQVGGRGDVQVGRCAATGSGSDAANSSGDSMKRGVRVRTTSLIGYGSSIRVIRVPGTKLPVGALGDQPDPAGLDEAHDEAGRRRAGSGRGCP